MLPKTENDPARCAKNFGSFEIALGVARDLPTPPLSVDLRPDTVARATMPEAAIQEDCDPGSNKDEVRPAP